MNLVPQLGLRSVYTWQETMQFLGMKRRQVEHLVESGQLVKAHKGRFGFAQSDLNSFLTRLNSGKAS